MYKEKNIKNDDGEIIGTISGHANISLTDDVFENYFIIKHKLSAEILEDIKKIIKTKEISILTNMLVDEDDRGNGYGNDLIELWCSNIKSDILLIADTAESPFLLDWYSRLGFEIISYCHGFPIMIKKFE